MHEENGGDGRLSLAVALVWPVQRVGLQDTEQVLLPGRGEDTQRKA